MERNVDLDVTLYRQVLDLLYDGVCIVDSKGTVVLWNRGAERLWGYGADEVVGLRCSQELQLHANASGKRLCDCDQCPTMDCIRRMELIEDQIYLHHRDGHLVPVVVRISPLIDGEGKLIGAAEIICDNMQEATARQRIDELERLALLDPLTGIGNRRFCSMALDAHFGSMHRYGNRFGVIFVDIDHFKMINDAYGHDIGDRVLAAVSRTLSHGIRTSDSVYRWGGEEFVAIIENVDTEQLGFAAEKLRRLVETTRIAVKDNTINTTVSLGATLSDEDDDVDTIIKRADRLMYRSKVEGRNRVSCDPEDN
jgi:diguanylate cyclase (GGDEF)-like protein/PAS domain S-box-containing protein